MTYDMAFQRKLREGTNSAEGEMEKKHTEGEALECHKPPCSLPSGRLPSGGWVGRNCQQGARMNVPGGQRSVNTRVGKCPACGPVCSYCKTEFSG